MCALIVIKMQSKCNIFVTWLDIRKQLNKNVFFKKHVAKKIMGESWAGSRQT